MGFSILPRNKLCSIIISRFRVGFRTCLPRFRVGFRTCLPILMDFCFFIICWFLLVPGRVRGFVSLLLWVSVPSSFAGFFWFRVGFRTCFPTLVAFCSVIISLFLLVPGRVPGLVSLLLWVSVSSSFAGFFWFRVGFGAYLPTLMGFCFIIICWFLLVPDRVPGLVSLPLWVSVPTSFAGSFWLRVGFRACLSILVAF